MTFYAIYPALIRRDCGSAVQAMSSRRSGEAFSCSTKFLMRTHLVQLRGNWRGMVCKHTAKGTGIVV
ncbi:MAG: hypothetical protein N2V77_06920 [Canidatus Methanoxibalbensis ujae]|nr:hypothetical protein [Candidatus Methanoxibalbensis ujae]